MKIFLSLLKLRQVLSGQALWGLFIKGNLILLATILIHLVLFKTFEAVTWTESFWQTWQTFTTVGYGNRPAETIAGRWTTVLFGTMGIAFLGVILSQAFDLKQDRRERRRLGMLANPIRNGVVMFNYPGDVSLLSTIREIRYLHPEMGFCVVDEKLTELPPHIVKLGNVVFLRGEMLREETYVKAALGQNRIFIVFPKLSGQSSSDALTQLIVRKISRFIPRDGRLVYVLVDPDNDWLFKGCEGTSVFEYLEVLALVQEVTDKYSSVLVEKLFLNTKGANPNTVVPDRIVGWSWHQFQTVVLNVCQRDDIRMNPLGIVKKGKTYACPAWDTVIESGDLLSVAAYPDFNWDRFEQRMVEERGNGDP